MFKKQLSSYFFNTTSNDNNDTKSNNKQQHGITKLFYYVQKRQWKKAIVRSQKYPHEVTAWVRTSTTNNHHTTIKSNSNTTPPRTSNDNNNYVTILPIHLALYLDPPLEFIRLQLDLQPLVSVLQDDFHRLPLHIGCMERASLEVITMLLGRAKNTAMAEDHNGQLPLHLLILSMYQKPVDGHVTELVKLLLRAYPQSSRHRNTQGDTPVDLFYLTEKVVMRRIQKDKLTNKELICKSFESVREYLLKDPYKWPSHTSLKNLSNKQCMSSINSIDDTTMTNTTVKSAEDNDTPAVTSVIRQQHSFAESATLLDTSQLNTWIAMKDWDEVSVYVRRYPATAQDWIVTEITTTNSKSGVQRWSRLPLHEVCRLNPTRECVAAIIDAFPLGLQSKESLYDRLPIHIACSESPSNVEVIDALLLRYPSGCQVVESKQSYLPLHCAIVNGAPVDVIRMLLRSYPDGAKARDIDDWLPIHHAAAKCSLWIVVEALLLAHPDGVKSKEKLMGRLPIHLACWKGAPLSVIRALLKAYPSSIDVSSNFGSTPMDMAKRSTSSLKSSIIDELKTQNKQFLECWVENAVDDAKVVTFEDEYRMIGIEVSSPDDDDDDNDNDIDSNSQSSGHIQVISLGKLVLMKDWHDVVRKAKARPEEALLPIETKLSDGSIYERLPIHEACRLRAPPVAVEALIQAYPEGLSYAESLSGKLPIHYCVVENLPDVTSLILKRLPECLQAKEANNLQLPIHIAASSNVNVEIINEILRYDKDCVKSLDADGWLPIHHACAKGCSKALISALALAYPEGCTTKEPQIGRLPIHLCAWKGASKDVLKVLVDTYPESLNVRTFTGSTPLSLAERSTSFYKAEMLTILDKSINLEHNLSKSNLKSQQATAISSTTAHLSEGKRLVGKSGLHASTKLVTLIVKRDWSAAEEWLDTSPNEAAIWNEAKFSDNSEWHRLPLHEAVRLQPPKSFIARLLKAYPKALRSKDHDGWLPLHLACECSASTNIIQILVDASPDAAKIQEPKYGYTPLHVACCFGSSNEIVELLVKANPDSLIKTTNGGLSALSLVRCSAGSTPFRKEIVATLQKGPSYWRNRQRGNK